jgi:hypothetical protein
MFYICFKPYALKLQDNTIVGGHLKVIEIYSASHHPHLLSVIILWSNGICICAYEYEM